MSAASSEEESIGIGAMMEGECTVNYDNVYKIN